MKQIIAGVLALWFAVVLLLSSAGAFSRPPGIPPWPIFIGAVGPIVVFFVAFGVSPAFRSFVMATDLPLVTAIQAWRFAGFAFLALHSYGVLPGPFAWPAGLGDMAIGITAPWLAVALVRRPGFAASRLFVVWNLLGILDLVVAIGTAAINQSLATGERGEITVAPMARLPLVLVPAYLVPLFVMLHLAALFSARQSGRSSQ